jgi:hypothetical protein
MLSPDAAMVVGLASTAMPFADSPEAEAERWLRVLRLHGEAGRALTTLGVGEAAVGEAPHPQAPDPAPFADQDVIASVSDQALHLATDRGAATVGTVDVLLAVMEIYGPHFDCVLRAHGATRDDVIESLATATPSHHH